MIINIRGTNGSGKTHLARQLIGADAHPVDLVWYDAPTKKVPDRKLSVEGWGQPDEFFAVGSYKQGCGGMDTIPSFELQQSAVRVAADWKHEGGRPLGGHGPRHIVCEGVLASTVYGSWGEFFQEMEAARHSVIVAYLDTPLELCLERITARQIAAKGEAREIKTDLVANKIKAIEATRARFKAAGILTVTLRHGSALSDLHEALEYGAH